MLALHEAVTENKLPRSLESEKFGVAFVEKSLSFLLGQTMVAFLV